MSNHLQLKLLCEWTISVGENKLCDLPVAFIAETGQKLCKPHAEHLNKKFGTRITPCATDQEYTQPQHQKLDAGTPAASAEPGFTPENPTS